jgi:deoxyribonucleoside regulator
MQRKMEKIEVLRQMVSVARYYYLYRYPRSKIADILGVSRQYVSKLLDKAIEEGLVDIKIIDPFELDSQLGKKLCKLTGLQDIVIVPSPFNKSEAIKRNIGMTGAAYLSDKIKPGSIIGIGWGATLNYLVQNFQKQRIENTKVVPLLGGRGNLEPRFQVNSLVTLLAEKISAEPFLLYAPVILDSKSAQKEILSSVAEVVDYWDKLDVVLVGIGSLQEDESSNPFNPVYIPIEERSAMKRKRAVGDMCLRYFNIEGEEVTSENYYKICIGLDQLKKAPLVIGLAGNMSKLQAIQGVIAGKYINVLITDETVAQELLLLYSKK